MWSRFYLRNNIIMEYMLLLYTLLILCIVHFVLYYMNIDILTFTTQEHDPIINELEKSLNQLKDMNKNIYNVHELQ